jgi:hypothetical protein
LAEEAAGRDQATIPEAPQTVGAAGRHVPIPKATQRALRTLEWIERAENLCICGPSWTGKGHWAEALGHLAIDNGRTVAWHTLESLAMMMRRQRADDSVAKAITRLIRADPIVIDLCRHRDYAEPVTCQLSEVPADRLVVGARASPDIGIVSRPDRTTSN